MSEDGKAFDCKINAPAEPLEQLTAKASSRFLTCMDTDGWLMRSFSAAFEKLRSRAIRRKIFN